MPIGTTNFPSSLDTATTLVRAANKVSTTVGTGGVTNVATTITVGSTTGAPADGICVIEDEIIAYTGTTSTTITGCTRGFNGTTAASHAQGVPVYFDAIIANHHSVHTDAIVAVETKVGSGSSTPTSSTFLKGTGTGTSSWSAMTSGEVTTALGFTPATSTHTHDFPAVWVATDTGNVAATAQTTLTVTCPATYPRCIGGGVSMTGVAASNTRVVQSAPAGYSSSLNPTGWTGQMYNASAGSGTMTTYAICVKITAGI